MVLILALNLNSLCVDPDYRVLVSLSGASIVKGKRIPNPRPSGRIAEVTAAYTGYRMDNFHCSEQVLSLENGEFI